MFHRLAPPIKHWSYIEIRQPNEPDTPRGTFVIIVLSLRLRSRWLHQKAVGPVRRAWLSIFGRTYSCRSILKAWHSDSASEQMAGGNYDYHIFLELQCSGQPGLSFVYMPETCLAHQSEAAVSHGLLIVIVPNQSETRISGERFKSNHILLIVNFGSQVTLWRLASIAHPFHRPRTRLSSWFQTSCRRLSEACKFTVGTVFLNRSFIMEPKCGQGNFLTKVPARRNKPSHLESSAWQEFEHKDCW